MSEALQTAVARQRLLLRGRLAGLLERLALQARDDWPERASLERLLAEALPNLPSCKYLYVLDRSAHQITANASPQGLLPEHLGRDRSDRPYLAEALAGERFSLSPVYISRNARRPSLTAIQRIEDESGNWLGFLGADFDLRELPLTRELYQPSGDWVQLKGDPAIRGGLFSQQRVESLMDARIDEVLALLVELMTAHGVFHGKLHFSSSRATTVCSITRIWPIRASVWPIPGATTRAKRRSPSHGSPMSSTPSASCVSWTRPSICAPARSTSSMAWSG